MARGGEPARGTFEAEALRFGRLAKQSVDIAAEIVRTAHRERSELSPHEARRVAGRYRMATSELARALDEIHEVIRRVEAADREKSMGKVGDGC